MKIMPLQRRAQTAASIDIHGAYCYTCPNIQLDTCCIYGSSHQRCCTWNVAHKCNTIVCNVIYTRQAWRVTVCAGALGGREVKWCRDQVFKPTNTRQTVARMHVQSDQTHFHCLKFALGRFY